MIAMLSDFFVLLISSAVLGMSLFLPAQILYLLGILDAGRSCTLFRLVLFFHITAPVLAAFFFAWSMGTIAVPSYGAEFDYLHMTRLPVSYYFYDHYKELRFLPFAFAVWGTGFVGIFSVRVLQNRRFLRQLKKVCPAETDCELEALKNRLAEEYHIRKPIRLCRTELNISPFITGIFHPVIYLPQRDFSEKHLEFILRHEIIHCRRADVFFRYLAIFVKSVYWFNPFLRLFSGIFYERCEIACDEVLLRDCGRREQLEYARCIADFAGCRQADLLVGFQSRSTAEHRIASIAKMRPKASRRKKRPAGTAVFAAGIAILFLVTVMLAITGSTILRVKLGERMEKIHITNLQPNRE